MKNTSLTFSLLIVFLTLTTVSAQQLLPYQNPALPINERVKDLLDRMTIEEKAAQMVSVNNEVKNLIGFNADGTFNLTAFKEAVPNGIGQITRPSETRGGASQTGSGRDEPLSAYENALLNNALQKYFIEETRLGIPAIFHEECLHGLVAKDATSYPHPIALAGMFDLDLTERIYASIAEETRSRGAHQALTPVLDIARDARWGRVEETYGEDPFLAAEMAKAAVRGFQGDATFTSKKHIVATLKHFAAHGQPVGGMNTAPANYSERVLREIHLFPFKEAIQETGALSVMSSYHEIDGVPGSASTWLLQDILRDEWGFTGFVVSDYFSIRELHERWGVNTHRVARSGKEAAALAIKAGVNIELPNPDTYLTIPELVESGEIAVSTIDRLVGDMLRVKFQLGLFDDPYINAEHAQGLDGNEPSRKALALEAALKSITLLKNSNQQLPLNEDALTTIAVIGPNADRAMVGGYTGEQPYHVTVLEGIRNRVGQHVEVLYAEGSKITVGGSWVEDKVTLPDEEEELRRLEEAVEIANKADVVILALGGNEQTAREAWNNYHMGDRASIDLFGNQNRLVDALYETGKPIISVVFSGRPLAYNNLHEKSQALFHAWYLGQESGNALAQTIFGDVSPSGKLPISFPRSVGHLPVYYNHKPSARRGYLLDDVTPLFHFGYGLSYTSFSLGEPRLTNQEISKEESTDVLVEITNTGPFTGDETVQLYLRDRYSSVTRPVKELKGFERVTLAPGASTIVRLQITPEHLKFYDINMDYVVEPGEFSVFVGTSSRDEDLQELTLTVTD